MGEKRKCRCELSGGQYLSEVQAVIWGRNAVPLGIANQSFAAALSHLPGLSKRGHNFEVFLARSESCFDAFIIQKKCKTLKHVATEKFADAYRKKWDKNEL